MKNILIAIGLFVTTLCFGQYQVINNPHTGRFDYVQNPDSLAENLEVGIIDSAKNQKLGIDNTASYGYGEDSNGKPVKIEFVNPNDYTQSTFGARFTDSSITVNLTQDTWVKMPGASFTAYYEHFSSMVGDSVYFTVGGTAFDCFVTISGRWSSGDSISMALFYDNEIIGCTTIEAPGNVLAPLAVGAVVDVAVGKYFSIGFMNRSSDDDITLFCGTFKIVK